MLIASLKIYPFDSQKKKKKKKKIPLSLIHSYFSPIVSKWEVETTEPKFSEIYLENLQEVLGVPEVLVQRRSPEKGSRGSGADVAGRQAGRLQRFHRSRL